MTRTIRTQVGIVGAGPAGMMLAHLLHRAGVESVVVEARSRQYVQERVRAGVLEQGTRDLMIAAGVGARMQREGIVHHGLELRFGGRSHRIDLSELTGGKAITIYPQREVVKDLTDARMEAGGAILFEAEQVTIEGGTAPLRKSTCITAAPATKSPATSSPDATGFTAFADRPCPPAR